MLAELWRQYKHEGNTNAREKLVLECLPMVKALAQRFAIYTFPCCDNDDLVSMGVIGLLDALEKKKSPWVKWFERLGGFYDKRFHGPNWREKERKFWEEKLKKQPEL